MGRDRPIHPVWNAILAGAGCTCLLVATQAGAAVRVERPGGEARSHALSDNRAVAQAEDDAAGIRFPVQRKQIPQFHVGEIMPEARETQDSYPGIDLPRLREAELYVRTDEFVYRINRKSRVIQEVIPIATVILR